MNYWHSTRCSNTAKLVSRSLYAYVSTYLLCYMFRLCTWIERINMALNSILGFFLLQVVLLKLNKQVLVFFRSSSWFLLSVLPNIYKFLLVVCSCYRMIKHIKEWVTKYFFVHKVSFDLPVVHPFFTSWCLVENAGIDYFTVWLCC